MASASFSPETFRFLTELRANNNREWFAENKERYEAEVLEPALDFVNAMHDPLLEIAPHFTAIPKKSGGSLMRIYRDTRFSPDKTPYKTNVGIQFRHEQAKDVHSPGYYVHLDPDQVFVGVGMWRPDRDALAAIRTHIVEEPAAWTAAMNDRSFARRFELGGDTLKRAPRGYDPDHPLIEDLKRKDFIAIKSMEVDAAQKPRFRQSVERSFRAAEPFMRFLCDAVGVRF